MTTTMTTTAAGAQPRPAETSAAARGEAGRAAPGSGHDATTHRTTDDCTGSCACGPVDRASRSRGRRLATAGRRRWERAVAPGKEAGMATAEYAIAMIAAVGFAGLLVAVLTSSTVRELLTGLVTSALSYG